MNPSLDGKVAVVTGAASGIGLATVELLVACGAKVLAADFQEDAGRALAARFEAQVRFMRCDVTVCADLKAAIDGAAAHFGGLDILFSNAGAGGAPGGVAEFDEAGWDRTQALLLRSVAAGTAYAMPHMVARGGGSIINTSSVSALQAGYAPLSYSVAKAGVLHYTRVAAAELAPLNIRINAVVPGFIATNIFGAMMNAPAEQRQAIVQAVADRSGRANPLGRSGRPIDIAQAVVYLASDAASFITGTHITVDGGLTIGPRHSWDLDSPGPMTEVLGMTPRQMRALRTGTIKD